MKFYEGSLEETEVILLLTGIGKVNAAVGTSLLIDRYNPDLIINTGVAGGFGAIDIGDIVVSSEVCHHDVDVTIFEYEHGQVPNLPRSFYPDESIVHLIFNEIGSCHGEVSLISGAILSGDSFTSQDGQIKEIREKFPHVMAVEMESAAIAQTCYLFGKPFLILRAISDTVNEPNSRQVYEEFMPKAAANSISLMLRLLRVLQESEYGKNR